MHTCLKGRRFSESKASGLLASRADRYVRAQNAVRLPTSFVRRFSRNSQNQPKTAVLPYEGRFADPHSSHYKGCSARR
jgi:hypothetical protein